MLAALLVSVPGPTGAHAVGADDGAPPVTAPTVTANEFLPENADVTDCIGALERPGCGSESRGGWRQTLVFGLMAAGLVLVFGRVAVAVRRSRREQIVVDDAVDGDSALPSDE